MIGLVVVDVAVAGQGSMTGGRLSGGLGKVQRSELIEPADLASAFGRAPKWRSCRVGSAHPPPILFSRAGLGWHEIEACGLEVIDATAMPLLHCFDPLQECSTPSPRDLLTGR